MRKCKKCGNIELSKTEAIIMKCLPETATGIAEKLKKNRTAVFVSLERMKSVGLIYGYKDNSLTIWKRKK
jgi:hypothetical protein